MAGDVPSPAPADDPARHGTPPAPMALYRRYRPATFAELKGQDHVTEPLRQALRSGRVHHAYLFSGPRGCGKTSSARILARSLNCEQGPTPDPCGTCASCIALAPSGPGSIDVIEIDAASHGGVDDARDLRERAFYAPVSGRFKIYIVDEAHMVTREGFNALLKLVEEPPPHLKFVFATTEPEKVIPTIRSRTHHYPFRLMPPAILRGLLEEVLASEGVRYEPDVLPVVVRAGAGSARDALSVLDQLLAGSDDRGLTYDRAVALLGFTDDSLLDEVAEAFAAGDGAAVFRSVDRVVEAGHDPRRFTADLLDRLRDLIVLAAVPDAVETGLLDVAADRLDRMREQADRFGQARLARAAQTINAGLVEMRGATSPRLQLELICAQVLLPAAPAPAAGEDAGLTARLERLERRLGSGGGGTSPGGDAAYAVRSPGPPAHRPEPAAPPARTQPAGGTSAAQPEPAVPEASRDAAASRTAAPPGGPGTPDADSLRERWPEILEAVRRKRRVAWILLSNAMVDTLQDGILTLRFTREGEARGFSGSDYDQDLGQVLETMLGISTRIRAVSAAAQGDRTGAGGGRGAAAGDGGAASGPGAGGGASAGRSTGSGAPARPGSSGGGSGAPSGGSDDDGSGSRARGGGDEAGAGRGAPDGSPAGSGAGRGRAGAGGTGADGDVPAGAGGGAPGGAREAREVSPRAGTGRPSRGGRARAGNPSGGEDRAGIVAGEPGDDGGASPDDGAAVEALSGMDLIQRTLGGEVIKEIGDA
jgi:DNA polymerase III subunit gamma/tau